MAECSFCKQDMIEADGCRPSVILLKGKRYRKVLFGESDRDQPITPEARCHDCGAKPNNFHHPGCDWERCPICGGQAIACGCLDAASDAPCSLKEARRSRPKCPKKKSSRG